MISVACKKAILYHLYHEDNENVVIKWRIAVSIPIKTNFDYIILSMLYVDEQCTRSKYIIR